MLQHSKKCRIFAAEKIFFAMKLLKILIIFSVILAACGKHPLPNQDLMSAYEYLKKGEIDTAKKIAENAPCITAADSAMLCIVRGGVAVVVSDFDYDDSLGVNNCLRFYGSDNEKLAWAHLVKGFIFFNLNSWENAVMEIRTAEKLVEPINCNELKFLIYNMLALLNVDSQNYGYYEEVIEKLRKYAVTDYDKAEYYSMKRFGYTIGLLSLDSAKFYAKKTLEIVENKGIKTENIYFYYYDYAKLICDEDDSTAEQYIKKALEIDSINRTYALLGKIYLNRGNLNVANQYFAKALEGRFDCDTEEDVHRWLHDFYAERKDFEAAYLHTVQRIAAKDSIIKYLQTNDIKPVQARFEAEIENLKLKSSFEKKIFLTILISAVILAVLVLVVVFQKYKLADRSRKISEAQRTINDYNQKINELQRTNTEHSDEEIKYLQQKVKALEMKFSDIYVRGKELYSQILNDKKIGRWSKEDYKNFIDYYQSLDFLYVYSFETDYTSLTDRQKIFLILLHIGKTKEQVMQIMTIEESSFRSMKSRAEGQRK